MATRRLNYTNRQKIERADVVVRLVQSAGGMHSLHLECNLEAYQFPADASVHLEAYQRTDLMRFDWGRVGNLLPPRSPQLSEFLDASTVKFRLKVTASSGRVGVLLGVADGLSAASPGDDAGKIPLLPVMPADLDGELWRLDFQNEVCLLMSNRLNDWRETARSGAFQSLVYPAIVRAVLTKILVVEGFGDADDVDNWMGQWLNFATKTIGATPPPSGSNDEKIEWIDLVVASFGRRINALERFVEDMRGANG